MAKRATRCPCAAWRLSKGAVGENDSESARCPLWTIFLHFCEAALKVDLKADPKADL